MLKTVTGGKLPADGTPEKEKKNGFSRIFLISGIIFILFWVLVIGDMIYVAGHLRTEYKSFDAGEISQVEDELRISLDENITLNRYLREVAAGYTFRQLWFEVEDYDYFMENCVDSEYELRGTDNFPQTELYTYDENMNNKYAAHYSYYPKPEPEEFHVYTQYEVYFYPKENGGYYGKIYSTVD